MIFEISLWIKSLFLSLLLTGSHRDQIFYASSPESTITEIVNFDLAHKAKIFKATVFSCGICYSDVQGIDCVSFVPCQHVYCKECVTEHFSVNIKEGRVLGLCCPETDCESMAIPSQVSTGIRLYLELADLQGICDNISGVRAQGSVGESTAQLGSVIASYICQQFTD